MRFWPIAERSGQRRVEKGCRVFQTTADHGYSDTRGRQDRWLGRIVVRLDASPTEAFNHFVKDMAKFGWNRTLTVHARVSNMTFMRADRVALIQIEPASFGAGVTVWITVALVAQAARNGQV